MIWIIIICVFAVALAVFIGWAAWVTADTFIETAFRISLLKNQMDVAMKDLAKIKSKLGIKDEE